MVSGNNAPDEHRNGDQQEPDATLPFPLSGDTRRAKTRRVFFSPHLFSILGVYSLTTTTR
jgi:hypothetical protein